MMNNGAPRFQQRSEGQGMACSFGLSIALAGVVLFANCSPVLAVVWDQLSRLENDGSAFDLFAWSADISGTMAIVGAPEDRENGYNSGSAYLFDVTTGAQFAKLLPSDGEVRDLFGHSVAISGNTAVIGAYGDADNGELTGSAYLFDVTTGAQLAKLTASDGAASDAFGYSVAISGNRAIVGARGDDDNGNSAGSAYLFDITTGDQVAKLTPDDGAERDSFGNSVGISGNIAIVGASGDDDNGNNAGSAYLFDVGTGAQLAKLLPSDGDERELFGNSVAISGETAVVGAVGDRSAYLFDVATGLERAKLMPSDDVEALGFGAHISISGDTAIVGAPADDENGALSGIALLFDANTGAQLAKLLPSDGVESDNFGASVGISGNKVIAGATAQSSESRPRAYLFAIGLPGDFNGDGRVDAADYTTWRDGLGGAFTVEDYEVWRENFGRVEEGSSFSTGVPEPSAIVIAAVVAMSLPLNRRRM